MKIEYLNKSENEIDFLLEGVEDYFLNAIRRFAIGKVPTFAIEDVEFKKNSSVLFDEIIALRLGLIPLKTKDFRVRIGYEGPRVKFKLKARGPGMVYASQLKSSDSDVVPVYPKMPIVYLDENQEVELTATAIMGIGNDHAKFSPGLFVYRGYPKITISKDAPDVSDVCPRKVLKFVNGKLKVDESRLIDCDMCKACEEESGGKVRVEAEKEKFIVHVESWGQMSAKDVLIRTAKALQNDLEKFQKSFK